MKKLLVHEINLENYEKWPDVSSYPQTGFYLITSPGLDKFLVFFKGEVVVYVGEILDGYFEGEAEVKRHEIDVVQSFSSESKTVSEDFALQMLSVALHKQKI